MDIGLIYSNFFVLIICFFWDNNLLENIDTYKKSSNIDDKGIEEIVLYKHDKHEGKRGDLLKRFNSVKKIADITDALKNNKSHFSKKGNPAHIYELEILFTDKTTLNFTLYQSELGFFVDLRKRNCIVERAIATFKNDELLNVLN